MGDHGFWRDGGSLGLDFVGTIGRRRGELLREPADLERWLRETDVAARTSVSPPELEAARALRTAMAELVGDVLAGRLPDGASLAVVNAAAAVPAPAPQLVTAAGALVVAAGRLSLPAALAVVARDHVQLLGGPLADRLRACEAEDCSGVFVDVSRGSRRRWCASATCGNRARVRSHRARGS